MINFTIFTPTYNRADTLERCYRSILLQKRIDIEWLIIDDGSTDNTKFLVEKFMAEGKIRIVYIYQNNAGKQVAWNVAIQNANGQYFIGLDSDDALYEDALSVLFPKINEINADSSIVGLRCLSQKVPKGSNSIKDFSSGHDSIHYWYDEFASGISQERIDILKTKIIKEYPYPVQDGVKFIPEVWFYSTISKKYKFYYVNKVVRVFYDDLSTNRLSRSSFKKHFKGHLIARKAMLHNIPIIYFLKNPIGLFKTITRYLQACICNFFYYK
ncbi:TPA: glycosyltransferase family 2 protein [Escherichia coli]|nr:glycosyltransferase family 2 protein [Escherichia coli]